MFPDCWYKAIVVLLSSRLRGSELLHHSANTRLSRRILLYKINLSNEFSTVKFVCYRNSIINTLHNIFKRQLVQKPKWMVNAVTYTLISIDIYTHFFPNCHGHHKWTYSSLVEYYEKFIIKRSSYTATCSLS